jgi:hypothetical protein
MDHSNGNIQLSNNNADYTCTMLTFGISQFFKKDSIAVIRVFLVNETRNI